MVKIKIPNHAYAIRSELLKVVDGKIVTVPGSLSKYHLSETGVYTGKLKPGERYLRTFCGKVHQRPVVIGVETWFDVKLIVDLNYYQVCKSCFRGLVE